MMVLTPTQGWHAMPMLCNNCEPRGSDPDCATCHGSGIYENSHVVNDCLFINGKRVAQVESFEDDGPWYANAVDPQGNAHRLGAGSSHTRAADWCERITGYRVEPKGNA